jgi:hypothetical protein
MRGQALNYRAQSARSFETLAAALLWIVAAALAGWAVAIALGVWGDHALAKQAPWRPFVVDAVTTPKVAKASPTSAAQSSATLQLFGIADDRAYFKSGATILSVAEGDALPGGAKVKEITRDRVAITAASGSETTIALFKLPTAAAAVKDSGAAKGAAALIAGDAGCRLSAADRAMATWIEPGVASALSGEGKAFARMFNVIDPVRGGLRAQATGGTTAMFAIVDGDVLLRVDGQALKSGEAIATDIIARLQRGNAVVVDGERSGVARRWVFAPAKCRV